MRSLPVHFSNIRMTLQLYMFHGVQASVREKENRGLTSLAFHANITFAVYLLKGYSVTAALRSPKPSVRVQILLPLPEKAP